MEMLRKSVNDFTASLASKASVPGGGSASALAGSLAAAPPMEVLELTGRTVELLRGFADMGSPIAVSDAAVGAALALAALRGAEINVRVNTRLMQDRERAAALDAKAHALVDKYARQAEKIYNDVYGRLAR